MIMWRHKVDINPIRMPMQIANVKDKLAAACTLLDIFHIYFHSIDWFVDIHKNNICTEKKHTQNRNSSMQTLHKKREFNSRPVAFVCVYSLFWVFFFFKFVFVNGLAGLCHNWTQMNLLAYVDWNWWGWLGWK